VPRARGDAHDSYVHVSLPWARRLYHELQETMHGVVNADLSAASTVVLSPRVLPPYDPVTDLYGPPSLHWCHPPSQRVYPYPRGTDDSVCFGGGIKFDATSDEASDDDAASAASPTAPFALMACNDS
jgi:hypothetical protein